MNGTTTALHHFAHYFPQNRAQSLTSTAQPKTSSSTAADVRSSQFKTAAATSKLETAALPQPPNSKLLDMHSTRPSVHPPLHKNRKPVTVSDHFTALERSLDSLRISVEDSQFAKRNEADESFQQFSASPVYFPIELGSSFTASTVHSTAQLTMFPTAESALRSPTIMKSANTHTRTLHHDSFSSFASTSSGLSSSTIPSQSSLNSSPLPDLAAFQIPSPSKSRHSAPHALLNLPRAVPIMDFDPISPVKPTNKVSSRAKRVSKDDNEPEPRSSISSLPSLPKGSPPALLSVLIQQHRDSLGSLPDSDRISSSSLLTSFGSPVLPNPSQCSPAIVGDQEEENELANAEHEERLREGKLTLEADEDKIDRRLFQETPRAIHAEDESAIYDSEDEDLDSEVDEDQDLDAQQCDANPIPNVDKIECSNENDGQSTPSRPLRAGSNQSAQSPSADLSSSSASFISAVLDPHRRSMPVLLPCARCQRFQAGANVKLSNADCYACKCAEKSAEENVCGAGVTRRRGNTEQTSYKFNYPYNQPAVQPGTSGREQLQAAAVSTDSVIEPLSQLAIRPTRSASATAHVHGQTHGVVHTRPRARHLPTSRTCLEAFAESSEEDGIMVDSSVMQFELDL